MELINYIKYSEKVDILFDFYNYLDRLGKNPQEISISNYFENKTDQYLLPGEFLFLIKCFNNIEDLEIDIDKIKESKQQYNMDFYLFVITILNIHYLINLSVYAKINFYNGKIQRDIYDYFTEELNLIYKLHNF